MERKYKLNMPQLLCDGLHENWLLKELGDIHWSQITSALETTSDNIVDSRGQRLYPSFVRLSWSGTNLHSIKENDTLTMKSKLSRYGNKMFFSKTKCGGRDIGIEARLMSVFFLPGSIRQ